MSTLNISNEHDDNDPGHTTLIGDLSTIVTRRRLLLGALGLGTTAALAAIGSRASAATSGTAATTTATAATTAASSAATAATTVLTAVPEETAGPYPADGSNGVDVLAQSGIVRSNIRTSFGTSTTDATGVPTTINLTVLDASTGQPVEGAAVYLWNVNHAGQYSMYSAGAIDENYLRGVQVADADGHVTFLSYYPACYDGRWPHIHYEVYPDVDSISDSTNKIATSQMAMPDEANQLVFATSLYTASPANYATVSLATDMVFSDGTTNELPTVTGNVDDGFVLTMDVPVNR